jgi:hypothetical protein
MSEINNDAQNYDAKQAVEEIATGEQKAPSVNVEADYEASKQFSASELDKRGQGAEAAAAATAPEHELPQPEEPQHPAAVTGDPSDYREMAKDVGHKSEAGGNVTDDLVQKAIEKGQPAQ